MAIAPRGLTVCGPSCVCDTSVRVKDLGQIRLFLLDELLELGNLANLFECKHFIFLVSIDSEASRVLKGVSKAPKRSYTVFGEAKQQSMAMVW